jgi:uncharacterized protein
MAATVSSSTIEPVLPNQRIEPIDILRGIALFGVLAINLLGEFRVSIFQQFVSTPPQAHTLDRWIETYLPVFIELKAFALFSLLFGIGLAIQAERISDRGGPTGFLLVRRLAALLVLGTIHLTLIWNGDILTEYAVAGFIALPFLFLPRRWLGIAALLFSLRYVLPYLPYPISFPNQAWLQAHIATAAIVYKHGNFLQILRFEQGELRPLLPLHVFIMARTVALFLFGAFCWSTGLLKNLSANRRILFAAGVLGLAIGGTLTVLTSSLARPELFGSAESGLSAVGELALTLGYAGTILYVTTTRWGMGALSWAAPLGRMAFTNYIVQSVVFSFLFFGWGLGWYGMRSTPALLIGICVYVLQAIASDLWLKKFRFGPVEWLWRSMMYGTAQPMRLEPPLALHV